MALLESSELDGLWGRLGAQRGDTVHVLCEYRDGITDARLREPVLEISDPQALHPTLKLRREPELQQKNGPQRPNGFTYRKKDSPTSRYREAWSKVLVACGLAVPRVDPVIFDALLGDPRCLKFYFDTNVLASGIAHWLLEVFRGRAHFETSVLVDRELMRWVDRGGGSFFRASTITQFHLRTQWRLARQILAARLEGSMITRPAPDQSALMLAKFRDEGSGKSPDADMLLLEQARLQVRDQPRNTRTVFLSGDRNLATTAAAVLGPESVLWVDAGPELIEPLFEQVCLRGWWEPRGLFGRLHIPPWSHLIRGLMAACHRLVFEVRRGETLRSRWALCRCLHHGVGVPSDHTDPVFALTAEEPPEPPSSEVGPPPAEEDRTSEEATVLAATPLDAAPAPTAEPPPLQDAAPFPWAEVPDGALGARSWRLAAVSFWEGLQTLVLEGDASAVLARAGDARRGAYGSFVELGWMTPSGAPGPHYAWLTEAWRTNDLDALHRALQKLNAYDAMWTRLEALHGSAEKPTDGLWRGWWGIARSLGQTTELGGVLYCGDAPTSPEVLERALEGWMPHPGASVSVRSMSELAARWLRWSPWRLDRTLSALRKADASRWHLDTEGEFTGREREEVASLRAGAYDRIQVDPEGLTFGGVKPIGTIRRVT